MKLNEALRCVQQELKAPKNLENKFGGYSYRSAEGILEAVKPLLNKYKLTLVLSDDIVEVGGRVYVRANARLANDNESMVVSAYAREPENKKGMDEAQITGSTSSYSRKYAMNGLFNIDDVKDADATNDHGKGGKPAKTKVPKPAALDW